MVDASQYTHIVEKALEVTRQGVEQGYGGPFGAVIFNSATLEILAVGCNHVIENSDPTAHAEVHTIRMAAKSLGMPHLAGYSIYATGQPCFMCLAAICWARLDAYYYTTTYAEALTIGFDDGPIRDSLVGASVPLVPGTHWPNSTVRDFFLSYGGNLY